MLSSKCDCTENPLFCYVFNLSPTLSPFIDKGFKLYEYLKCQVNQMTERHAPASPILDVLALIQDIRYTDNRYSITEICMAKRQF